MFLNICYTNNQLIMRVYFVRHGQTNANIKEMHQADKEPLSEVGQKQAEKVAKRLAKLKVDLLLASPFARTKKTAEIISKEINKSILYSSLFVEIKRVTEIEGKKYADYKAVKIREEILKNVTNPSWHYADEENFFEQKQRGLKGIKYLESLSFENVVLVTHGDIMKILIATMLFDKKLEHDKYLLFRKFFEGINTGITVCEYKNNKWKLLSWSDHSHLWLD
jgi:broad specificity phosphatase PhoE